MHPSAAAGRPAMPACAAAHAATVACCRPRLAALRLGASTLQCLQQRPKGARHACSSSARQAAAAAASAADTAPQGSVLFISPVWPERSSSAAGVRTSDLIGSFQARGWAAAFASPSATNEHTEVLRGTGVATFACQPNRESQLAEVLAAVQPSVVVLDRFYAEVRGGRLGVGCSGSALVALNLCNPAAAAAGSLLLPRARAGAGRHACAGHARFPRPARRAPACGRGGRNARRRAGSPP